MGRVSELTLFETGKKLNLRKTTKTIFMKKLSALVVLMLVAAATVFGQKDKDKPRESPKMEANGPNVHVTYGQPSKKGREIFGGLVPYGQVWRTGANEATEITFDKDGMFGGKPVKKGTYSLFTIPNKGEWEIILNSELKQWGAFGYDKIKSKDVLHVKVPAQATNKVVEKFTISVMSDGLMMEWDKTRVLVPMAI